MMIYLLKRLKIYSMNNILYLLLILVFSSCTQLKNIDRSNLNHGAMDFNSTLTKNSITSQYGLESLEQSTSTGCSTCAE